MSNTEIGRVTSVFHGLEDHGILTITVGIDFGGSYQAFGGLCLSGPHLADKAAGTDFHLQMLKFFGVRELREAVGTVVIVHREGVKHTDITGLERMLFDGGAAFRIEDWRRANHPELSASGAP